MANRQEMEEHRVPQLSMFNLLVQTPAVLTGSHSWVYIVQREVEGSEIYIFKNKNLKFHLIVILIYLSTDNCL